MGLLTDGIGIQTGQAIQPEHILRSINALSGVTNNDILIKGSLTSQGNFINIGSASISDNLNVVNGSFFVGNNFIVGRNGDILGNNAYLQNINITGNNTISGSLIIKNIPQQDNTTFLTIDPISGTVGYSSGSLKQPDDFKYFERNFSFGPNKSTECSTTFKNKIYNLSLENSEGIQRILMYSKINNSTLDWTQHRDLETLENWIGLNYDEKSPLYWIKFRAIYKPFYSGEEECILTYSKIK